MKERIFIFPTDTVYGIGCKILDVPAYEEIYKIKNRDKTKQLALLAASIEDIEEIISITDIEREFINRYLPGEVSIILDLKPKVNIVRFNKKITNIAFRIPKSDVALKILRKEGPLFTTSLNDSGKPPLFDNNIIQSKYGNIATIVLGEVSRENIPSTIVKISKENDEIKILREGALKKNQIFLNNLK